jgi:hypothetical protein
MNGKLSACVLVCAAFALGGAGCSPPKVDVTGRVTYNGAPLKNPGGKIIFVGPDSAQCDASINYDGTYRAIGVSAGLNRVAVYYPNPDFKPRTRPTRMGVPAATEQVAQVFLTPEKYASVETSKLSVQAAVGTVFDADLTDVESP